MLIDSIKNSIILLFTKPKINIDIENRTITLSQYGVTEVFNFDSEFDLNSLVNDLKKFDKQFKNDARLAKTHKRNYIKKKIIEDLQLRHWNQIKFKVDDNGELIKPNNNIDNTITI